ncbi:GNAT family N-acetyltransferase [Halobacteriales archaeon QS_1_68_17]|nr:MAG: GNAT family N-acetyltransferase [Halobacteriales archaeon QS_1_68_17]
MYVRDAKNRDEVWLLDRIEEMGLDEQAFRSRDYVIAIDEETNEKAGFGRIRVHKTERDESERESSGRGAVAGEVCELTSIGVLEAWRGQGVGAHVVERLVQTAGDKQFETVYALTPEPEYLAQFGFEGLDEAELPEVLRDRLEEKRTARGDDVVPVALGTDEFVMPARFRDAFKRAGSEDVDPEPEEGPEDFGIDPDEATYKYDTGR